MNRLDPLGSRASRRRAPAVRPRLRRTVLAVETVEPRTLPAVVLPGFTETPYVTGLPPAAGLTVDSANRTLYTADDLNTGGILRRIAPDRSILTAPNAFGTPSFYPFVATQIQSAGGSIYVVLGGGILTRVDPATGAPTVVAALPGFDVESGIAVRGSLAFVTDGTGVANQLATVDLATGQVTSAIQGLPNLAFGVELDPTSNAVYFAEPSPNGPIYQGDGRIYRADPSAGTYAPIATAPTGLGKFAVDPTGRYAFTRDGSSVYRVTIADGTVVPFLSDLENNSTRDLAFGPASTGNGSSLYVADGDRILEVGPFAEVAGTGRIAGTKFHDFNGNGVRDAGELALAGWTIYLDEDGNGRLDPGERSTSTDSEGRYAFDSLPAGTYTVLEVNQAGWTQTAPNQGQSQAPQRLYALRVENGAGRILQLDPSTGAEIRSFPMPGSLLVTGPQGLAVGPDALYVLDGTSGRPHTLFTLDPDTGSVLRSDRVETTNQLSGLAYLNDRLYLLDDANNRLLVFDTQADRFLDPLPIPGGVAIGGLTGAADLNALFATNFNGDVSRIDPASGAVVETLRPGVGELAGGLAYVDGELIGAAFSGGSTAYRIDANTGAVLGTLGLAGSGSITGLGGDGTPVRPVPGATRPALFAVQVVNGAAGIVEIDPATGAALRTFAAPGDPVGYPGPQGLALGVGELFYIDGSLGRPRILYTLDPTTGAVLRSDSIPTGNEVSGLAYLAGRVYLLDSSANQLLVFDPVAHQVVSSLPIVGGVAIGGLTGAADLDVLFAANFEGEILRLDPITGTVLGRLAPDLGQLGGGLAYAGGRLIAAPYGDSRIAYRIDPATGAVLDSFVAGTAGILTGLGGDGLPLAEPAREQVGSLFQVRVANGLATITRVDPATGDAHASFPAPGGPVGYPGPQGLAVGVGAVYYLDGSLGRPHVLYTIDPETGATLRADTLPLPNELSGLALLGDRLYILDNTINVLHAFDLTSHQILSSLAITGRTAVGGLTGAADLGLLFATNFDGEILRIDPVSGAVSVLGNPGVGQLAGGLAYARGELIVAPYGDNLVAFRIDPTTGALIGTLALPPGGLLTGLGGDGVDVEGPQEPAVEVVSVGGVAERLFAVRSLGNVATIFELSPVDGTILRSYLAPGVLGFAGPQGLAVGDGVLYYLDGSNSGPHTLYTLDPDTGAVLAADVVDASNPRLIDGLAYLDGEVYFQVYDTDQILVFDLGLRQTVRTLSTGVAIYGGLTGAADRGLLFATTLSGSILAIDPSSGSVLAIRDLGQGFLAGLAYLRGELLASTYGPELIFRVDPDTLTVLGSFLAAGAEAGALTGLGGDGVSRAAGGSGYRVRLDDGQEATGLDFGNRRIVEPTLRIDDGDFAFRTSGPGWSTVVGDGVQGDYRVLQSSRAARATNARWTFQLPAGTYELFVTWTSLPNSASNASYRIFDGSTLISTVTLDQRELPSDVVVDGVRYRSLGRFTIRTQVLALVLDSGADGAVVADAAFVAAAGSDAGTARTSSTGGVRATLSDVGPLPSAATNGGAGGPSSAARRIPYRAPAIPTLHAAVLTPLAPIPSPIPVQLAGEGSAASGTTPWTVSLPRRRLDRPRS